MAADLGVWRYEVNNAEYWNERYADHPHHDLLPESQRLHEPHLGSVPDAR